jgi:hypothetical protein
MVMLVSLSERLVEACDTTILLEHCWFQHVDQCNLTLQADLIKGVPWWLPFEHVACAPSFLCATCAGSKDAVR